MPYIKIKYVREEYDNEEVRRLNLQPQISPIPESLLIPKKSGEDNEEVEVNDEIKKGEKANSPAKALEEEAAIIDLNAENTEVEDNTEIVVVEEKQGNLDGNECQIATKEVETNLVLNTLEEGDDLRLNENAKLVNSKGEVTPEDSEVREDDKEEERDDDDEEDNDQKEDDDKRTSSPSYSPLSSYKLKPRVSSQNNP